MSKVRVGAYGVCVSDDRILLTRFSDGDRRWSLPGGGVDFGEDPFDGVVREVKEETGYIVSVVRLLGVTSHVWSKAEIHMVSVLYEVRIVGGELTHEVDGSSDEAAWVPLASVEELAQSGIVRPGLDLLRGRPADGRAASQ
ncbi:NUDIX hydrolase [Flindersiella endophytica]